MTKKQYPLALHILRRDLRLADNTALQEALQLAEQVIVCFIFDPRQIEQNDYRSDPAIFFMAQSLQEIDEALQIKHSRLFYFYGVAENVVARLIKDYPIAAVFVNRDYTPFSLSRDTAIKNSCVALNIDFFSYADALLHEPEEVLKADHTPYTVFSYFYKKAGNLKVRPVEKNHYDNYYRGELAHTNATILPKLLRKFQPNLLQKGGRSQGLARLKQIKYLKNYAQLRDFPEEKSGTLLSAHLKFGTVSVREVYHAIYQSFGKTHTLITELYWRDFFSHIAFHFPHVFHHAFHKQYDALQWHAPSHFRAWCEGRTGFPIVDAGMRELNTTGFMHNRVRMIVASFLVKDLHIDWRLGEKYFAQKLVDYDPAVNNGNWQWVASTGCDAQPYFRIFNPWRQQQKFDPDCVYIKRFVPELSTIPSNIIHEIDKHAHTLMTNYPAPIVNHDIESKLAIQLYKINFKE